MKERSNHVGARYSRVLVSVAALGASIVAGSVIGAGLPGAVASAQPLFSQAVKVASPDTAPYENPDAVSCTSPGNCTQAGQYEDGSSNLQGVVSTETGGVWAQGQEVTAPTGAAANPQAIFFGVSCKAVGYCTATGQYDNSSAQGEAMAANEVAGTWGEATEITLPAGASAGNGLDDLYAVSCTSSGDCVGVGEYATSSSGIEPMAATESGGTWSQAVEVSPPSNSQSSAADLFGVSCTSVGNCVAGGHYVTTSSAAALWAVTESNGTWGQPTQITLPSDSSNPAFPALNGISCVSVGNCAIAGSYANSAGDQMMIATESDGTWAQATSVASPSDADSDPAAELEAISCISAGNCTAAGNYNDTSGNQQGAVATETNGTWAQATEIAAPPGAETDPETLPLGVSCNSSGNCTTVGYYVASSGNEEGFAVGETDGTWAESQELVPPDDGVNPEATLSGVSCTSAGNCAGVGGFQDQNGDLEAMTATETGGVWGVASEITLPAGAASNPGATLQGVSCTSAGNCVAVGSYQVGLADVPMIDTETSGSWAQATELTALPTGADSSASSSLSGVDCPTAGNCEAVGQYGLSTGEGAMVVKETSGSWGTATATSLPTGADTSGQIAYDSSISCVATTADCTLVGSYDDSSSQRQSMAASETSGTWAQAVEIVLPADAASSSQSSHLSNISCPSSSSCEAVGLYTNTSAQLFAMAVGETNGSWGQATALSLPDGAQSGVSTAQGISCTSPGNCTAVGYYPAINPNEGAMILTETNGSWAQGVVLMHASDDSGPEGLYAVSCVTSTSCEAVGAYNDQTSDLQAMAASTVPVPATPTGVGATAGAGSVSISWAAVSGATSYSVYMSTTPGGENYSGPAACSETAPTLTCTLDGLVSGTTYYLTVVAHNSLGGISSPSTEVAATPTAVTSSNRYGYWEAGSDGGVFSFGSAGFHGSMAGRPLDEPVVGIAATPSGKGYWLVASDGGVFSFGDASFYGSEGGKHLDAPIVGIAATPSGNGYWLVASDGGVFSFGDASFYGSEGGKRIDAPIVGIAAAPTGNGYWLTGSDGGVYSFGDATFYGSESGKSLDGAVVGIAADPNGDGYWLSASGGGVFNFGHAAPYGSEAGKPLDKPVDGMASTPDGAGYWLVASDGGVFSFDGAEFCGSMGGKPLNAPIVGIASADDIT